MVESGRTGRQRPFGLSSLVLRNLAAKTLSEIPIKLIRLAMLILAARWLGRSEFGVYSYAVALGYMLVQFGDLGLQFHLARMVSRERAAAEVALARVLRSKLCLVAVVAASFLILGAVAPHPRERWLLWIVGAALILNSFVELANYLFRGFQRLEFEARINLLNVGLGTTAGLVAVRLGAGSIGLACGLLLGAVTSCAVAWSTIHRRFVPRARWVRNHGGWLAALRPSLPIGLAIVLSVVYFRVDVLFLKHFRDPETVGLYSAAYRIVESFMFLPGILLAALFPAFSEMTMREPAALPRLLRASLRLLLGIACLPAILLIVGADPIIRLAFGESYRPAVQTLRILSPALVLIFLNYGLTHFLIALGRARMNVVLAAICLAVNVSSNWILIPRYGMNAAAATTVVTEAVLFGGAFLLVHRGIHQMEREERNRVASIGSDEASSPTLGPVLPAIGFEVGAKPL